MISFIIPTLNEEKTIEKTLKNISAYSSRKEIIVSDGGSIDKTVEIARNYADKILVWNGPDRQNIPMGRNDGAKSARGDLLVFMDADVTIPNIDNFFKKALDKFEKNDRLVGLTTFYMVSPEAETFLDRVIFKMLGFLFYFYNNMIGVGGSGGEFMMVRADIFKKIGGFNEKLAAAEDMDFFWRLAKNGKTYFEKNLRVYHSGRRAHKVGWPKLLYEWTANSISAFFFKKAVSKEWEEIR